MFVFTDRLLKGNKVTFDLAIWTVFGGKYSLWVDNNNYNKHKNSRYMCSKRFDMRTY